MKFIKLFPAARLKLLFFAALIGGTSCAQENKPGKNGIKSEVLNIHPELVPALDESLAPFYHSVASGDPTQTSVIIWTRITLFASVKKAEVNWEISEDKKFKKIIQSGKTETGYDKDFTVKVDVTGLREFTRYYYRFSYQGINSVTGETKTLPENPVSFDIAFASCSNFQWGYFNNYRFMAEDTSIDLVVHLGDYIYEYAAKVYGHQNLERLHVPAHEIITTYDYRTRYSQYRLDADLAKAHQLKPFITTWDDHEFANNAYVDGALNHDAEEGDYYERKNAAKQAYYEWLPVRENKNKELYRSFRAGKVFNLIILDTRIAGRTKQFHKSTDPGFNDSTRSIIGKPQFEWLTENLKGEQAWNIIGNQVPFGPMYLPDEKFTGEKYWEGWDGYPFERNKLIGWMKKENIKNNVFVTGDYHSSFAFESDLNGTAETPDNVGVEFIVTSVTSANDDEYEKRKAEIEKIKKLYLKNNPHLKYLNNTDHGYVVLRVSPDKIKADFYYATTILSKEAEVRKEKAFQVQNGKPELVEIK
jgi:alkaline phosphatase D